MMVCLTAEENATRMPESGNWTTWVSEQQNRQEQMQSPSTGVVLLAVFVALLLFTGD